MYAGQGRANNLVDTPLSTDIFLKIFNEKDCQKGTDQFNLLQVGNSNTGW